MLVIDVFLAESCDFFTVQRMLALDARIDYIALINFELHRAADIFLRFIDKSGKRLAQRREPLTVVNQIRKFDRNMLFKMLRFFIEADALQNFMCGV